MKTLSINTRPTPDADPIDIEINLNNLDFAFKAPLQPWLLSLPGATFSVETLDESKLAAAGLVPFDVPEGTTAYVGPKNVIGYLTPQLGTYVIVFNGSRIGVKATSEELKTKLGVESGLVLGG